MGTHEQSVGATDEWYTPAYVFEALGACFDVDVASPGVMVTPWIPVRNQFIKQNSLEVPWNGFVWMNPPWCGRNGIVPWLEKFFAHNNGIALTPDRTSAPWWPRFAVRAAAILFVSPKIKFIDRHGQPGRSPAQGTCLMGAGPRSIPPLLRAQSAGLGVVFRPDESGWR